MYIDDHFPLAIVITFTRLMYNTACRSVIVVYVQRWCGDQSISSLCRPTVTTLSFSVHVKPLYTYLVSWLWPACTCVTAFTANEIVLLEVTQAACERAVDQLVQDFRQS